MEKEVRHIDDCGPGLILAEDIFKNSALVMPKDAPLDDDTIVKLKAFGVEWVAVYVPGDPEETVLEPSPMPDPHREFKKQYRENVSRIKGYSMTWRREENWTWSKWKRWLISPSARWRETTIYGDHQ